LKVKPSTGSLLYFRKKWRKICYKVSNPSGVKEKQVNGVNFSFDFSFSPYMKKIYHGLFEFTVQEVVKSFLSKGDVFVDVGANIGYISAIGAGAVGATGEVHSFEPVPLYFNYLSQLPKLNPGRKIYINNFALGEHNAVNNIDVAVNANIGANSMVNGFVQKDMIAQTIAVPTKRLDDYLEEKGICPNFIKIDVEGYEFPVLKGAARFFEKHKSKLPPILVEITPRVYSGSGIAEFENYMFSFGYKSYDAFGKDRVDIKKLTEQTDILFKI
jgi:FkbM family methyltransferase